MGVLYGVITTAVDQTRFGLGDASLDSKGVNKEGSFLRMTRWHKALSLIPGHNGTSYFITRSTECLSCSGRGSMQAILSLARVMISLKVISIVISILFSYSQLSRLGLINYTKVIVQMDKIKIIIYIKI